MPLNGAGQHCLLSMQGPYTAVKKPSFEDILGKYWHNCSKHIYKWCKCRVETVESLSGDSGESCGRPSKIPLRAMDNLVLGPLGVGS